MKQPYKREFIKTNYKEKDKITGYKIDFKFHRIGAEAYDGAFAKSCYIRGKLHNLNGPAKLFSDDGSCQYWINGNRCSQEFHAKCQTEINVNWSKHATVYFISCNGMDFYHRVGGPAIVYKDETRKDEYWLAGRRIATKEEYDELVAEASLAQDIYEARAQSLPNPCWVKEEAHKISFFRDENCKNLACLVHIDKENITNEHWFNERGFDHRDDGPSIIYYGAAAKTYSAQYYLNGQKYSKSNYDLEIKKIRARDEIEKRKALRSEKGLVEDKQTKSYDGLLTLSDGTQVAPVEEVNIGKNEWFSTCYESDELSARPHKKYIFANSSYIRVFEDGSFVCFDAFGEFHREGDRPAIRVYKNERYYTDYFYNHGNKEEQFYTFEDGLTVGYWRMEREENGDGFPPTRFKNKFGKLILIAYDDGKRYWKNGPKSWEGLEDYKKKTYTSLNTSKTISKQDFYVKYVIPEANVSGYYYLDEKSLNLMDRVRKEVEEQEDKEFSEAIDKYVKTMEKIQEPYRYVMNDGLVVGYSTIKFSNKNKDISLFDKDDNLILNTNKAQQIRTWFKNAKRIGCEYIKDKLYFPGEFNSGVAISREEFYKTVVIPNLRTGQKVKDIDCFPQEAPDVCRGPMKVFACKDGLRFWYSERAVRNNISHFYGPSNRLMVTIITTDDGKLERRTWFENDKAGWIANESIRQGTKTYEYCINGELIIAKSGKEFYDEFINKSDYIIGGKDVFCNLENKIPYTATFGGPDQLSLNYYSAGTVNDSTRTSTSYKDSNGLLMLKTVQAAVDQKFHDKFWYDKNGYCFARLVIYNDGGIKYFVNKTDSTKQAYQAAIKNFFGENVNFVNPNDKVAAAGSEIFEGFTVEGFTVNTSKLAPNTVVETETPQETKEDNTMSDTISKPEVDVKTVIISDFKKGSYRFGQSRALSLAKKSIMAGLQKDDSIAEHTEAFAKVLDTPVGTALLSFMMGVGLTYAPKISENEHVAAIAKEFRVDGMHKVGNEVTDQVKKHVLPVLQKAITMLPQQEMPKIRVQTPENAEAEEKVDPAMKSKASA